MTKSRFNEDIKEIIDSILLDFPEVEVGKAFGYPAYYVNGKMFACIYEDGVSIKVPEETVSELVGQEGIFEFRPMDRHKMKEWILIIREHPEGYLEDRELLKNSLDYVYQLSVEKNE